MNLLDPSGLQWWESPPVFFDIVALVADVGYALGIRPLYGVGVAASVLSTLSTVAQYAEGKATLQDVFVSGTLTVIGLYPDPRVLIGADIAILLYDVRRSEPCETDEEPLPFPRYPYPTYKERKLQKYRYKRSSK